MEQDVYEFIQKKLSKGTSSRNRLFPFKEEITLMREKGLAFADIREYLESKGVRVTIDAISKFYKRHINSHSQNHPNSLPPEGHTPQKSASSQKHLTVVWPENKSLDELV